MTLRDGQREYYYEKLDQLFPNLKEKYIQLYGNQYISNVAESKKIWQRFETICNAIQMPIKMNFYKPEETKQLKLF